MRTNTAPQRVGLLPTPPKPRTKAKKRRNGKPSTDLMPAARAVVERTALRPAIRTQGEAVRIRHREPIWSPTRSAALSVTSFIINPGRTMFSWLKGIAPSFEYYAINSMSIIYTPSVSFNETGQMALAIDYDPADDDASLGLDDILAMSGAAVAPVWKEFSIKYDNPRTIGKFCTAIPNFTFDRFTDAGQLIVAYGGNTATDAAQIGKLSVQYDISLFRPQPSALQPTTTVGSILLNTSLRGDQAGSLFKVFATYQSMLQSIESVRDTLVKAGFGFDLTTGRVTVPAGFGVELFGEMVSNEITGNNQILTFANAESSPVNCTVTPSTIHPPIRSAYNSAPVYNAARATVTPTNPSKICSFIPSLQYLGFQTTALIGTTLVLIKNEL